MEWFQYFNITNLLIKRETFKFSEIYFTLFRGFQTQGPEKNPNEFENKLLECIVGNGLIFSFFRYHNF